MLNTILITLIIFSDQGWRIRVNFGVRKMTLLKQREKESTDCTWMLGHFLFLIKGSRFRWRCEPVINGQADHQQKLMSCFFFFFPRCLLPPSLSLRVGQEPPPSAKEWSRTNTLQDVSLPCYSCIHKMFFIPLQDKFLVRVFFFLFLEFRF